MLIYLASPYFHPDPKARALRVKTITKITRQMMLRGDIVFSPIAYSHATKVKSFTHEDWLRFDLGILAKCDKMIVVPMVNWQNSKGIAEEIQFCDTMNIPWEHMSDKEFCGLFLAET